MLYFTKSRQLEFTNNDFWLKLMSNTRSEVLRTLLNRQRTTINELAEAVGINPISVRHHISKLEAEGFVTSEEERHGVGRPRRLYFLTNAGMEQFPSRYLNLSLLLLEKLKENLPQKTVNKLFKDMATEMVNSQIAKIDLSNLNIDERIELIQELLLNEGFTVEINTKGEGFEIKETSCPYKHVGTEHPEICLVDETIITQVLATSVEKTHCVLDGDPYCRYVTPTTILPEIRIVEG